GQAPDALLLQHRRLERRPQERRVPQILRRSRRCRCVREERHVSHAQGQLLDGARLLAGPLRHHPAARHGDTRALLQVRGLASAPVRPLSRAHPVLWEPLLSTAAVGSLSVSARRTDRLRRRLSLAAQPIPSPALYAPTFRNSGGRSALTYGSN